MLTRFRSPLSSSSKYTLHSLPFSRQSETICLMHVHAVLLMRKKRDYSGSFYCMSFLLAMCGEHERHSCETVYETESGKKPKCWKLSFSTMGVTEKKTRTPWWNRRCDKRGMTVHPWRNNEQTIRLVQDAQLKRRVVVSAKCDRRGRQWHPWRN